MTEHLYVSVTLTRIHFFTYTFSVSARVMGFMAIKTVQILIQKDKKKTRLNYSEGIF